jgi:hypothetical protein
MLSKSWQVESSAGSEPQLSPTAALDGFLGFSRDEVARYMWGYGGNAATARKAMQATHVSACSQ